MTLELKKANGIYIDNSNRIWVAIEGPVWSGTKREIENKPILIETATYQTITDGFEMPQPTAETTEGINAEDLIKALQEPEVVRAIQKLIPKAGKGKK